MQLFIAGYQGNMFLRFLRSFFVNSPLSIWFGYVTAYWPSSATFINYTNVSDEVLADCWKQAQQSLGTQPFPTTDAGANGGMHAADPRALTVQPKHVTVVSVPDVPIADLIKIDPAWSKEQI